LSKTKKNKKAEEIIKREEFESILNDITGKSYIFLGKESLVIEAEWIKEYFQGLLYAKLKLLTEEGTKYYLLLNKKSIVSVILDSKC
jgi:hypothetical protein